MHLKRVYAMVDAPDCLEIVLHLLLELLGDCVHSGELLQVTPFGVVLGPAHMSPGKGFGSKGKQHLKRTALETQSHNQ